MKRLLSFCFLLLFSAQTFAGSVSLVWDANSEPELAGYRLYYGTSTRLYTSQIDVGKVTTYTVTGLPAGTYYFAVTAYSADAESALSNEVFATVESSLEPVTITIDRGPAITAVMVSAITENSATIAWVTSEECSGVAFWGTDPTRMLAEVSNNLGTTDHLSRVSGLKRRTHYVYRVESVCNGKTLQSAVLSFNTK
jgi:hypothetical protein